MTMVTSLKSQLDPAMLKEVASKVGTPFWIYDAGVLRQRIRDVKQLTASEGLQARFAMKSCSATRILREMRANDIWIDAVSGNEVLRALRAGFPAGHDPAVVLLTADVFRDTALGVVRDHGIMPNVGSAGMLRSLESIGYRGPVAIRINPGFGHGHVNACDTGGPSSKHGIWFTQAAGVAEMAKKAGMQVTMIHAHIGSGPKLKELLANLARLAEDFADMLPGFPEIESVSLGGGIPHRYYPNEPQIDLEPLHQVLVEARAKLCKAAGRPVRLEIEPGRYFVAPSATLVGRVTDVKTTETNEKGDGQKFVMVDAGFVDLVRPSMYGSYHHITIAGRDEASEATEPLVVAGPLCESGDVFTRDSSEFLAPRNLPVPEVGDLLCLHDAGAYGYQMSSNYNSIGRAPQVWLEEDGQTVLMSRRETVDDILKLETEQTL